MPTHRFLGNLHDCYHSTDTRANGELAAKLQGQNVVIAGSGRGIGRATAELFSYGAKSLSLVALEQDEVDETGSICKKLNPTVEIYCQALDVCDPVAVRKFLDNVVSRFGSIDTLIMNAGRPPQWLPTHEGDPLIWWNTAEVSMRGAYNFSRYALPYMRKQEHGGRIIFTSSAGAHSNQGMSSYTLGKLGMVRLAEIIHVENHDQKVKAFAIHPGAIATRFFHDFKNKVDGKTDDLKYVSADAEGELKSAKTAVAILGGGDVDWDTPYLAGGMMTVLASGQLDFMSGRYVDCAMRIEDLIEEKDAVVKHDLYRVRLHAGENDFLPRLDY
ncbi:3-oxoacyl-[acyl-carrier-protein] FabG [Cyphellophora attinorum]|uniref:3-oxoacyl-[acyl-carrier-protein] FabG n=1 Tax=Cyphellophora attinorum TaxID=1664694 RepID=A0A0N0NLC9_9EURO|nr:3-oxoacyl-[acyl-carrier-protein] FabG [Phialophora attinorum]KPI38899.1 3-oxoacyl-[acyl-carrier-protein] FabG [Phialophora attinorum]